MSCHNLSFELNFLVYYVSIVVVYALRLENCLAVSSCILEHGKSWQKFKLRSFRIVPYTHWSQNIFEHPQLFPKIIFQICLFVTEEILVSQRNPDKEVWPSPCTIAPNSYAVIIIRPASTDGLTV